MTKFFFPILISSLLLQTTHVFASGAVARQRQMKDVRQQAEMQQYQQVMAQQQMQAAQEQAAVQQYQQAAVQQYQQAVVQQQVQQQVVMQVEQQIAAQMQQQQIEAVAQQMLMQMQQKQAYVAAVRAKQIQYANDQQAAMVASLAQQYQQAVIEDAVKQKMALDASQMVQIQQMAKDRAEAVAIQALKAKQEAQTFQAGQALSQNRPVVGPPNDDVQDVVDITDVWRKLDADSRGWTLLIDHQAKSATVSEYIDRYRKQGVRIQGSPEDYVHMIDDLAMQNPSLLTRPFKDVLQFMAVMQYDFDNGMDKDILAHKMLGEQMYSYNKKRLGR